MTPISATHAFSGRGLACARGGRRVFEGLDFDLAPGGALFVLGPNGSGKSSLLRVMAGLTPAATGSLFWGEKEIDDRADHARNIRYLGHQDAVKPTLSVTENLRFWAARHAAPGEIEAAVERAMAEMDLTRLADTPGKYLSAGQKRRLNLARLLAVPAPLWLLDEPSTALDAASVAALENLIAAHRGRGGMIALSTHSGIGIDGAKTLRLDAFQPARRDPAEVWA